VQAILNFKIICLALVQLEYETPVLVSLAMNVTCIKYTSNFFKILDTAQVNVSMYYEFTLNVISNSAPHPQMS
jgi:hypothetical protein